MRRRMFLAGGLVLGLAAPTVAAIEGDGAIGQMFITGFRGTRAGDREVDLVCRYLSEGVVAGVILLRRNVVSPDQLANLTRALRAATPGPAPIVSIDQEGGRVARLDATNGFAPWMSASEVAASGMTDDEVLAYYSVRARALAEVGINLNFAPVVDLNVNPFNPIIGRLGRSYGETVAKVMRHVRNFISAHRAVGVATALKHFPGHGSAASDSHSGPTDISTSWRPSEFEPFAALASEGLVDTLMVGHLVHPRFSDGPGIPASLSRRNIAEVRNVLSFNGPVITDDMQMGAVAAALPAVEAALAAVNAGNSLLIYSNYRKVDRIETVAGIQAALRLASDRLDGTRVRSAVDRSKQFRSRLL